MEQTGKTRTDAASLIKEMAEDIHCPVSTMIHYMAIEWIRKHPEVLVLMLPETNLRTQLRKRKWLP
jgi:hypothetical protein